MVKTIKEMRDKAQHLQGDYLVAYEDMLMAFKEAERIIRETYETHPFYPENQTVILERLCALLGLDSE